MRKKLVAAAAVGAIALSGAAIGGTAFAAQTLNGTATSPLDRIKQALSGLVADKTITQDQADKVAGALNKAGIGAPGAPGGPGRPGGHGFGFRGGMRDDLAAAAKALGMSETDLLTELRAGKSLAAIAKEKNVSVDALVSALVTEAKQDLADAVKAGRLTQAQADQITKDLQARITDRVNSTRPTHGPRGWRGFGPGGPGQAPGRGQTPGQGGTPGQTAPASPSAA